MRKAHSAGNRAMRLISAQAPIVFRATMSGVVGGNLIKEKKNRRVKRKRR